MSPYAHYKRSNSGPSASSESALGSESFMLVVTSTTANENVAPCHSERSEKSEEVGHGPPPQIAHPDSIGVRNDIFGAMISITFIWKRL